MKKFAVFDIDGTLIRWQLYHAVVDRLAKYNLLGKSAHQQMHEARMVWKRREHREAFRAYENELIKIYEKALLNLQPTVFDKIVQEVAEEYKTQVYTYTRDLISKLKKQKYLLLAISGSHQELVEHVAKQYKFDDWAGTLYERKDNYFTGKKFIASYNKQAMLNKLIKKHNLSLEDSYAVGDSKSDVSLLELVEHPVAFNPDFGLFVIAQQKKWTIVIERKNVVYTLRSRNGSYVLA